MATFKFSRTVNIHWNGFDVKGPADTVFSIPDQLYEEFEGDIRGVEPSLTWIDINEFQTLKDSVPTGGYIASAIGASPISVATSSNTATISLNSGTALNGYLLVADGTGGTIWNPASTSGLTSVVGISPISTTISGGTVSVSLTANYQTAGSYQPAGTYVTGVSGTAPITASGTTSITVGIDQASLTAGAATTSEALRTYVKNSSGSTITKGQVVYVTGADGTNALIGLSSASTESGSSKTLGIAANTMTNNAFGYVIENGQLSNIDTSAATAGSSVWLGDTPGSYVFNAPPAEPSHSVYLGVVTKANVSTGEILVKVQNGYELNELHDVFVGGVSTALPLVYSSASSGWIAQELTSVGIADNAIVAAKIAAASVGTSKIDSGSSTSGQVLTANGSGGASFASLASSPMAITYNTVSTTFTGCTLDAIDYAGATAASTTFSVGMAVDTASNIAYQIAGRNILRKIDLNANTEMARLTVTATANERLTDVAFGGSKLICVSGPTAVLGSSQYFIIDPSAMTVQNTGNIKEAANYVGLLSIPTARYDSLLGKFTIHATYTTVTTGTTAAATDTRGTFRIVDPSTYSTRVHTFTTSEEASPATRNFSTTYANGTFMSHPIWYDAASTFISHRISGGGTTRNFRYYSDSAASTGFLTLAGSSVVGSFQGHIAGELVIEPTTAKANIYAAVVATSTNELTSIGRMSISTISADFASTGVTTRNFSDTTNTTWGANAAKDPTASVYPITGGFNVFNLDGTVYVLVGTELYDSTLANKYGNAAFGVTQLSGANNVAYYGNVIHLYKDGTDIKAIISRRASGATAVHLKRTTFLLDTKTLTVFDGTNTSPMLVGTSSPIAPSISSAREAGDYLSLQSYTGNLYGVNTSLGIYFLGDSTSISFKFWPIYVSSETMTLNYWKVG
jgi:hypothetical protein